MIHVPFLEAKIRTNTPWYENWFTSHLFSLSADPADIAFRPSDAAPSLCRCSALVKIDRYLLYCTTMPSAGINPRNNCPSTPPARHFSAGPEICNIVHRSTFSSLTIAATVEDAHDSAWKHTPRFWTGTNHALRLKHQTTFHLQQDKSNNQIDDNMKKSIHAPDPR